MEETLLVWNLETDEVKHSIFFRAGLKLVYIALEFFPFDLNGFMCSKLILEPVTECLKTVIPITCNPLNWVQRNATELLNPEGNLNFATVHLF